VAQFVALVRYDEVPLAPGGLAGIPATLRAQAPHRDRTAEAYAGYGTWVDIYDYVLSDSGSGQADLGLTAIDEMAKHGVRTVYLQAAQLSDRTPGLLVDRDRVGQMLVRAHQLGMQVVGWYLPRFTDIDRDLAHLQAIADFEVLDHRFDGVAVDIEWTEGIPDPVERSNKLVEMSERLRDGVGRDALGAIVLPPVQIEVVNPAKWPEFPWARLASLYDVWLPMGYWTERREDSGYRDGKVYTEENVRRIRDDLDDPDALVHAIGGIGDEVTDAHAAGFVDAINKTHAIGGSIYDWSSLRRNLNDKLSASLRPPDL
jgi:hypothetical protein